MVVRVNLVVFNELLVENIIAVGKVPVLVEQLSAEIFFHIVSERTKILSFLRRDFIFAFSLADHGNVRHEEVE